MQSIPECMYSPYEVPSTVRNGHNSKRKLIVTISQQEPALDLATMKLALALILPLSVFGCTTIIVGKDASADGSVMCTHSDDGESNPDALATRELRSA